MPPNDPEMERADFAALRDRIATRNNARRSQRKGQHGESIARLLLCAHGVRQVVRIETGWKVKRVAGRIVGAVPIARVCADWRGLMPGGQSVMAEAKERKDILVHSDLEWHQHDALREHAEHGGASFVVVIYENHGAALLPYPIADLMPRRPGITPLRARTIAVRWMDL